MSTTAMLGVGPIPHYVDENWTLEATSASTLVVRRTTRSSSFQTYGFTYPTVLEENKMTQFRCVRLAANSNVCLKVF